MIRALAGCEGGGGGGVDSNEFTVVSLFYVIVMTIFGFVFINKYVHYMDLF